MQRAQERITVGAAGMTRDIEGTVSADALDAASIGGSTIAGGAATLPGGVTADSFNRRKQAIAQAAAMAIDCSLGTLAVITFLTNAIFTISAPLNPVEGMMLTITFKNTSGGALGAATWNAVFKRITAITPGNNAQMSVTFYYDGVNWIEMATSAATVPV